MLTALLFSLVAVASPVDAAAPAAPEEERGFFEENWPTALDSDLNAEIYEKRVFVWALTALTWPIAGIVWVPGLILDVDVDEDHSGEAWGVWFKQMAPFVCCGPFGAFYATFALIYLGPVKAINLYNRHALPDGAADPTPPPAAETAIPPVAPQTALLF